MSNIKVPYPHMALNSHNVPAPDYLMLNTWKVAKSDPVDHIVGWVKIVAGGMPGGRIATLIFNAHGSPGKIHIGQGITTNDLSKFAAWNTEKGPLIKEIWVVACEVGGKQQDVSGGVNGLDFLRNLAMHSGATVTGALRIQIPDEEKLPIGEIDKWEGVIFTFDAYGNKKIKYPENMSTQPVE